MHRSIAWGMVFWLGFVAGPPMERTGRLDDPAIVEASGIVASRKHRGIFWVHNDSGNPPMCSPSKGTARSSGRIASRRGTSIGRTSPPTTRGTSTSATSATTTTACRSARSIASTSPTRPRLRRSSRSPRSRPPRPSMGSPSRRPVRRRELVHRRRPGLRRLQASRRPGGRSLRHSARPARPPAPPDPSRAGRQPPRVASSRPPARTSRRRQATGRRHDQGRAGLSARAGRWLVVDRHRPVRGRRTWRRSAGTARTWSSPARIGRSTGFAEATWRAAKPKGETR